MLTARIPLSVIPEPVPPKLSDEAGKPQVFEGYYSKTDGDLTTFTTISEVSSGADPLLDEDRDATPHFIEVSSYQIEDRTFNDYSWWEIRQRVVRHANTPNEELVELREGPAEWLEIFRKRKQWLDKWGHYAPPSNSVMYAFCEAVSWAKTSYVAVDSNYIFITYSVKWFFPNRKRMFCRDLSRAMKVAKAAGVNCRILTVA